QTLIRGLGERHLEIIVGRLARKFGVHAVIGKPKIAYRETFRARAEGQGKHKKQTGGRGQYGDCWIRIAPLPRGSGFQFVDEIVGGVIPRQYIPAVERGVQEAAVRGPVAGYPVVDFKVELYDGSYHDVDSNEMSFKMAGILAFRKPSSTATPPRCTRSHTAAGRIARSSTCTRKSRPMRRRKWRRCARKSWRKRRRLETLNPPHLDGYLRATHGEFRLEEEDHP